MWNGEWEIDIEMGGKSRQWNGEWEIEIEMERKSRESSFAVASTVGPTTIFSVTDARPA